jgi:hypothetical protein
MLTYKTGLKKGIPIALGYFPVSFSFGVLCVSHQLPLGLATLISFTNVTSSGQFAGVNLMLSQSTYFEIALTLLMINARYFLMSLSLSQKIEEKMTTLQRLLISLCAAERGISNKWPNCHLSYKMRQKSPEHENSEVYCRGEHCSPAYQHCNQSGDQWSPLQGLFKILRRS